MNTATQGSAEGEHAGQRRTRIRQVPVRLSQGQSAAHEERRAQASADHRRLAALDRHAHSRYRRAVRQRDRSRSEEGAAVARQVGVQPLLRELDAHAHHLRDRREAPVGGRAEPEHQRVVDEQGRVAARHDQQPLRDARRHVRRAPRVERRAVSDRRALRAARARDQRRRRPSRAPDAGPARHVHDPPLQARLHEAARGDRRRHSAFARRALGHSRADHARRARSARDRPAHAACRATSNRWACTSITTSTKA